MATAFAAPLTINVSYKPMAVQWGVSRTMLAGPPANDSSFTPGRTTTAYTCTNRQSAVLIFSLDPTRVGDYPTDLEYVYESLLVGREETLTVFARLAGEELAKRWSAGSAASFVSSDADTKLHATGVRPVFSVQP